MTTREMSLASGASSRQLQNWDERGYLKSAKIGRKRSWDEAQIPAAKLLRRLVRLCSGSIDRTAVSGAVFRRNMKKVSKFDLSRRYYAFDRSTGRLVFASSDANEFVAFACSDSSAKMIFIDAHVGTGTGE